MALSCFDDRSSQPGSEDLRRALGEASSLWVSLIDHVKREHPPITEEWAFAGASFGWSLRLIQKKRRVLYLIPQRGAFLVGVVLGEKAVAAAMASRLPKKIKEELQAAKKYAEGRGIRVKVESEDDLGAMKALAALKVEH